MKERLLNPYFNIFKGKAVTRTEIVTENPMMEQSIYQLIKSGKIVGQYYWEFHPVFKVELLFYIPQIEAQVDSKTVQGRRVSL